jgi:excisionase family DNA binding protein
MREKHRRGTRSYESRRELLELARRGRMPAHRIERRWRFVRREIEEWLLDS